MIPNPELYKCYLKPLRVYVWLLQLIRSPPRELLRTSWSLFEFPLATIPLPDSLCAWFRDMSGHINASKFPYCSPHSKIHEAVWCAVGEIVILVARILEGLIEVPGWPDRRANDGPIDFAILEPRLLRVSWQSLFKNRERRPDWPTAASTAPHHLFHEHVSVLDEIPHGLLARIHAGYIFSLHLDYAFEGIVDFSLYPRYQRSVCNWTIWAASDYEKLTKVDSIGISTYNKDLLK